MNMLVQYDHAMSALSTALNTKEISTVLKSRDDLALIKLHAKQLHDRALLADATEFQMRVERWLGALLRDAREAGELYKPGGIVKGEDRRPTLKEIGLTLKLASKVKAIAALDQPAFDSVVLDMRQRLASGKAKTVSVAQDVEKGVKRASRNDSSPFAFSLASGKTIGGCRLGKLRTLLHTINIESKMLQLIIERIGPEFDPLAVVEQSITATALGQIIAAAQDIRSAA